jgi:carbon-monoxide dehydrogenase medium subunit
MKPAPFTYHDPTTVDDAVALLRDLGDEAKVLAGGQSLIPLLSLRLTSFGHLIDVGRIPELRGITCVENESLYIGATTVHAKVGNSPDVAAAAPLLARSTPLIGHFQIRNRGTIGGAIAHADPAAEYPAVAIALDAEIDVASARGRRTVPAAEFFQGFWSTSLEPDELLVGLRFRQWTGRCGFAAREFARRHGDFAIAGAVVGVQIGADDRVERCAIGLIGLGPTPIRAIGAEQAALGQPAGADGDMAKEVGHLAVSDLTDVPSDLHGSARYRRRVGAAMVNRAWIAAVVEARGV